MYLTVINQTNKKHKLIDGHVVSSLVQGSYHSKTTLGLSWLRLFCVNFSYSPCANIQ